MMHEAARRLHDVGCMTSRGTGLTMEGGGHTLRHVSNSVISIMEGAATMQVTSYSTHHASYIKYHR